MEVQDQSFLTLALAPLPPLKENPALIHQEVCASIPPQG